MASKSEREIIGTEITRVEKILEEKGYPKEFVFREFRPERNFGNRYDLCVFDTNLNRLLYVFEFKIQITSKGWSDKSRLMQTIRRLLSDSSKFIDENTKFFCIINIAKELKIKEYIILKDTQDILQIDLKKYLFNYEELKLYEELSYKRENDIDKRNFLKSISSLKWFSLISAVVSFIFLLLDIKYQGLLTNNRLILLGIINGTLLMPYFSTIKIGDMFEVKQK